jgi:thiol-disulfide isomerase/thioredoxin
MAVRAFTKNVNMRPFSLALFIMSAFATLSAGSAYSASDSRTSDPAISHPEASPFDSKANAKADVDAALARAKTAGRLTIIVMGANWCHDSRALAGWFATPRFAEMLTPSYELVYVDVGYRDRNLEIARRFGIKSIKGTPTVMIIGGDGRLLNKKDSPTWRNAASRTEDEIYSYFAKFPVH